MCEGGKISEGQAVFLIAGTILPTSVMFLPALIYKEAAQDSWISVVLLTVYGLAAGALIAGLGRRFPDMTVVQYGEVLAGRFGGKILGLLYALFFFYINTYIIREFGELFVTMFMPETPLVVFVASVVLASGYGVSCGLEVLARVGEAVMPVILFLLLLLAALIYPEVCWENFLPVLEKGIIPVLKGAFCPAAIWFAETVIMVMLIPYLNEPGRAQKAIFKGVVITGFFQLLIVAVATAVLGSRTARLQFPTLSLASQVSIAGLIERVEPFIMLIWVFGAFIKVGIFYYCGVLAVAQCLHLENYRVLVVPAGLVLTAVPMLAWGNVGELIRQICRVVLPVAVIFEVALPLLLFLADSLRRPGEGGAR